MRWRPSIVALGALLCGAALIPTEALRAQAPGKTSADAVGVAQSGGSSLIADTSALRECTPAEISVTLRCRLRAELDAALDSHRRRARVNRDWYYVLLIVSLVFNALAAVVGQWEIANDDSPRAHTIRRRQKNAAASLTLLAGLLVGASAARGLERQMRTYGAAAAELADIRRASYVPTSDPTRLYEEYRTARKQASLQSLEPGAK